MSSYIQTHRRRLNRFLLVLVAVLLITAILPKETRFKYDFELGKPWRYDDFTSPFEFAIEKSEAELELERAATIADYIPYYELHTEVPAKALGVFEQDFANWFTAAKMEKSRGLQASDSSLLLQSGFYLINRLYKEGILLSDSAFHTTGSILILKGQQAEEKRFEDLNKAADLPLLLSAHFKALPTANALSLEKLVGNAIEPNVLLKPEVNEQLLADALANILPQRGHISKDEKIIYKGEIVNEERFRILSSLRNAYEKSSGTYAPYALWLSHFVLVSIVMVLFTFFLLYYSRDAFKRKRSLAFSLGLITLMVGLTVFFESRGLPTIYLVPYCIVPILVATFFGSWTAFFVHFSALLIAVFAVQNGAVFLFMHLTAGLVAVFASRNNQYWSQFFVGIGWLLLTYLLSYFAISMIQEGSFEAVQWENFIWLGLNVFLCMLAYPLILLLERLFGTLSVISLRELTDLDKPLLKELSLKAPGTLQHSLQVANLAEAAIAQVGGNRLLARAGCLYHDIGKIKHPAFFIENQQAGFNPHEKITPLESAAIIVNHVSDGLEMARQHNLPESLVDFIKTHHGTTRVEFFYRKHLNENRGNGEKTEIDAETEAKFRYPGPTPYSKETAITMLADAVEASSRSLQEPNADDINRLVDKIVQGKIEQGQLDHADLTFKDITAIKKVFRKMLHSIYHLRVEYPTIEQQADLQKK